MSPEAISTLSNVKKAVKAAVWHLWAMAFWVGGRVAQPSAVRWDSPGNRRVLVLAPHPDDEACGCGGTILLHRSKGDDVTVAYATDGRRSRARGLGPEEMAQCRRREAAAGARALQVNQVEWMGLPEGEWRKEDLRASLKDLLKRLSPHLIYAPSRIDFHPEHYRVARCLADVLADDDLPLPSPLIHIYQIQVPLTPMLTNVIAPTGSVMRLSATALSQYETQIGTVLTCLRPKRYAALLYGIPGQVEEFWELTAVEYRALHRDLPSKPLVGTFRGVRSFALTDPLAYVRGLRERRRLSRVATRENER